MTGRELYSHLLNNDNLQLKKFLRENVSVRSSPVSVVISFYLDEIIDRFNKKSRTDVRVTHVGSDNIEKLICFRLHYLDYQKDVCLYWDRLNKDNNNIILDKIKGIIFKEQICKSLKKL